MRTTLIGLAPWLCALGLLGYLFWRVSFLEILDVLSETRISIYLPLLATATLIWFWLDAAAYRHLFSRFNTELSARDARALRGLTYLLTPVHWNLARAGIVARLHQLRGVPLLEVTSTVALYQTLDIILLSSLAFGGFLTMPPSAEKSLLLPTMAAVAILSSLYLSILTRAWPFDRPRLLGGFRDLRFHHAHRKLDRTDVARVFTLKLAYYGVLIFVYWIGASSFGFELELPNLIASVPIIQGVGALPISPAGLGTQQAAMVYFFATPGTEAAVVAFGLSLPILMILFRCVIGAYYLRAMNRRAPPGG